jgi:phytoene synthase
MTSEMRLISRAGKTFYFATFWLSKAARLDAARAYNFCRFVDDVADATPARPDRDSYLHAVTQAVLAGDDSHELIRPISPLLIRFPDIRRPLAALVEACRLDVSSLCIKDEQELESYAHGVAGNVGLIMYPILGGTSDLGLSYAADLGIAMQYTNIARDVLEDLKRERIYLPISWLSGLHLRDTYEINLPDEPIVVEAIRRLLFLADARYSRGLSGLHYLASENRFAIRVAAQCYRAIGDRVIKNGSISRQRSVVSGVRKIGIACKAAMHHRQEQKASCLERIPSVHNTVARTDSNLRHKTGVS